jgi:PadR family transcriptional regulator
MDPETQILPGTLDLLILKAVSLGPLHGYGVLLRIQQISCGALLIEQGRRTGAYRRTSARRNSTN